MKRWPKQNQVTLYYIYGVPSLFKHCPNTLLSAGNEAGFILHLLWNKQLSSAIFSYLIMVSLQYITDWMDITAWLCNKQVLFRIRSLERMKGSNEIVMLLYFWNLLQQIMVKVECGYYRDKLFYNILVTSN